MTTAPDGERGTTAAAPMSQPGPAMAVPPPRQRRSRRLLKRFFRRRLSVFGLVVLLLILSLAVFAPLFGSPSRNDFGAVLLGPSAAHPLGTDDLGRDTLARIAYGARVSMQAGVMATLLAMAVGVPLGLIAGYYRGWADLVISRFTDLLLAFPFLILAVGLAAILGPSLRNVVIALGISALPSFIRVTRGEVLGLREQDYVAGAVADGAGDGRILSRYVLPNAISPLLVQATVTVPEAIIGESVLSFLGLGVQPPTPSWGTMLSAAQTFLTQAPLLAVWPGVAIALAALSFNLVGDGLRDTLDPKATS
ncbi:MAG: ABC transporter, permease protein 2 (cluster 5, nickel/peptides/opines) [uncultured Nocardioidaceae bacterium]|uniref:ABC transporter, permease protein 2 (Cluster 5, nickel/peptides/opines) n=1 Tax=uncultured Nocardioidaceae bacterium TaxID=253824 RepID=A0A6J4NDA5_9ACTN|nr:MAG: ABC transporter, permease protein 2 (cluster 5, nickel/peptides/opines) [uncultured Nocardioidaceae bacterium]